jgi:hypothetical protein
MEKGEEYYKRVRKEYEPEPEDLVAIFVCESPPKDGDYFYETAYCGKPPIFFYGVMQQVPRWPLKSESPQRYALPHAELKRESLLEFRGAGYLLLDASYTPGRRVRRDCLPSVREELSTYTNKSPNASAFVLSASACDALVGPLKECGRFNVVNDYGQTIRFPGQGHQREFGRIVRPVLELARRAQK